MRYQKPVIKNSKGEVVRLTNAETFHANFVQKELSERHGYRMKNALGYEIQITSLTEIVKSIVDQKFYEIAPADYLPVRVGQGAWSSNLTTYRSFDIGDAFETGILNLGGQGSRLASTSTGVDALTVQVFNWAKSNEWTIMALEEAARSGNWDLITSLEKSRKRNFDLGIQRIAFLGANGQNGAAGNCLGLLNQAGITVNTTTITKAIKSMSPAELKAFQEQVIVDYRNNTNRSAWPDVFAIPESDYLGLSSQSSPDFPMKSTLQLLEEGFQISTRNKNFKILPLSYADAAYHADVASLAGKQIYTLLNYDEDSIRMDVPVPYTNTLANSINNFSFQNAAYAQFTGVLAYRPLELLYFTY